MTEWLHVFDVVILHRVLLLSSWKYARQEGWLAPGTFVSQITLEPLETCFMLWSNEFGDVAVAYVAAISKQRSESIAGFQDTEVDVQKGS
jgi:hypothetical protein